MKRPNRKRQTTSITLPRELVEEAREAGLNISRLSENAIKQALGRLKGADCPTSFGDPTIQDCKNMMAGPPGFEPGPPAPQADVLSRLDYGPELSSTQIKIKPTQSV